jgi:hypothetical protein
MKTSVTLLVVALAIIISLPTTVATAQTPDTVIWYLTPATGTTAYGTANVFGDSNSLGPAAGWQIASYNSNGQRLNNGAAGFPASETDTVAGRYVQFDAHPKAGHSFTVTNIFFEYGAAGSTNAMKGKAYYSSDNWVTRTLLNTDSAFVYPNSSAVPAMIPYTKAINVTVLSGHAISLRIYPFWVSSTAGSSSKYAVHDTVKFIGTTTVTNGVERVGNGLPEKFELQQNYPNPFNPSTTLEYSIAKNSHVVLEVTNILGQTVARLVEGELSPGTYKTSFDASKLGSGVYFYTIKAGDFVQTRKMILMK